MASTQYKATVRLYRAVPFDNTYQHTLEPASVKSKKDWLDSNYSYHDFNSLMYVRVDTTTSKGSFRLSVIEDIAEDYNYAYIDDGKKNQYFAFILGCRYINDSTIEQYTTAPQYSLYEFDFERDVMMSFLESSEQLVSAPIVRHHAIGSSSFNDKRIVENVPLGEYKNNDWITHDLDIQDCYIIAGYITNKEDKVDINIIDNTVQGATLCAFDPEFASIEQDLETFFEWQTKKSSNIVALYNCPKFMIKEFKETGFGQILGANKVKYENNIWKVYTSPTQYGNLDGYTPHNSKLLYYPYNFGRLYNDLGDYISISFQDWERYNSAYCINIEGCVTPPVAVKAFPVNYKGISGTEPNSDKLIPNKEYIVEISNFPLGSWSSDTYALYTAQNGRANKTQRTGVAIKTVASMATGLATGDLGSAAKAGVKAIDYAMNEIAKEQRIQDTPDQLNGNVSNGNVDFANNHKRFWFSHLSIRQDFAERIDRYFSRYGYSQNYDVKTPLLSNRPLFTFVQTAGDCFKQTSDTSEMANNEFRKINNIFMNGCTFWRIANSNKNNILNFEESFRLNNNNDN